MEKIVFFAVLAIILSGQMLKKYWRSWYISKAHITTSQIGKTKAHMYYFLTAIAEGGP